MKRKLLLFAAFFIQLLLLFSIGVAPALASAGHSIHQAPVAIQSESGNLYTFGDLGYTEKVMVGPYDSVRIFFSLPSTWQLTTNATITLRLNSIGGVTGDTTQQGNFLGGTLRVSFNNVVLDTILLDQTGEITKVIPIPPDALKPVSEDGRYLLNLFYDASFNCNNTSVHSSLIVSAKSEIDLAHEIAPFSPNLSRLPAPIYQQQSISPASTTIVIPDQPSAVELQSAFSIAAGLGSLTNGELNVQLIPLGKLTGDIATASNLVFVGVPSKLPIIFASQGATLPIQVADNKLILDGLAPDDGIIQMAVSPWNTANVILAASGNSETGVLKASQALSAGNIVPTGRPDVSVVSNINPYTSEGVVPEDRTLEELGYGNEFLGGTYGQYVSYIFSASPDQASSADAYLDVVTSHTQLLDFEKSGLTIFLNGSVVGSIQFAKDSDQLATTRLKLLPGLLRRGNNRLEVVSDLIPLNNCYAPQLSSNTVTIGASSIIHLPTTTQKIGISNNLDLRNFPSMFLFDKNLSDLAFVVAKNDPTSWNYAAKVAYYVGYKGNIQLANLQAAYGDAVPEETQKARNLLIFGRASTLPIIDQLKDVLPAPFEPGKDEAIQPALPVNYRLLPNVDVGYLQMLTSPWNQARAILTVMGNTENGIPMAAEKLINDDLVSQLKGNFSILYGDQILSSDTRLGTGRADLAAGLPVAVTVTPASIATTAPLNTSQQPQVEGRAAWILPAALITTLVIVVMVVFMVRNSFARTRSPIKPGKENDGA